MTQDVAGLKKEQYAGEDETRLSIWRDESGKAIDYFELLACGYCLRGSAQTPGLQITPLADAKAKLTPTQARPGAPSLPADRAQPAQDRAVGCARFSGSASRPEETETAVTDHRHRPQVQHSSCHRPRWPAGSSPKAVLTSSSVRVRSAERKESATLETLLPLRQTLARIDIEHGDRLDRRGCPGGRRLAAWSNCARASSAGRSASTTSARSRRAAGKRLKGR